MSSADDLTSSPATVSGVLRGALAQALELNEESIDLSTRITELPGIDSLKLVHVVAECERQWSIELDEDDLFDVRTGDDLCALISATIGNARSRA